MNRDEDALFRFVHRAGPLAMIAFGIFIFGFAVRIASDRAGLALRGKRTTARIVEMSRHDSRRQTSEISASRREYQEYTSYTPVFSFEARGRRWTVTSTEVFSHMAYAVEDPVEVYYDPEKPTTAELASVVASRASWGPLAALTAFSLLIVAAGLVLRRVLAPASAGPDAAG